MRNGNQSLIEKLNWLCTAVLLPLLLLLNQKTESLCHHATKTNRIVQIIMWSFSLSMIFFNKFHFSHICGHCWRQWAESLCLGASVWLANMPPFLYLFLSSSNRMWSTRRESAWRLICPDGGTDRELVSKVMWGNQVKLLWLSTALISPNDSFKNSLMQPLSMTPTGSPVVWTCHLKLTWSVGFMLFALFHLKGARLRRPRITLGSKAARWSDTETMMWRATGMFSSHVSFPFL